jgi:hypothetical protein
MPTWDKPYATSDYQHLDDLLQRQVTLAAAYRVAVTRFAAEAPQHRVDVVIHLGAPEKLDGPEDE